MLAYVSFVAFIFYLLHFAHWWMLKDALFWLFGTAVILFFNSNQAGKEKHYVRKIALDNFKFAIILDFVVNLYVFNLAVEIVLLPFLAALMVLSVVAATKDEYKPVKKFLNGFAIVITIGLLIYALASIHADPRGFATVKNLEDFLTPIVLTLTFLPFAYGLALYLSYSGLFLRVGFRIRDDKKLLGYTKWQILSACRSGTRQSQRNCG